VGVTIPWFGSGRCNRTPVVRQTLGTLAHRYGRGHGRSIPLSGYDDGAAHRPRKAADDVQVIAGDGGAITLKVQVCGGEPEMAVFR